MVIGGGISGLTMAMSLHQIGVPVRVYEAAREVTPLGVGINFQPNAVRELTELGLGDALARARHRHRGAVFLQQIRPAGVERAARPRRGLQLAAIFDPSRPAAGMLAEATRARIGDEQSAHRPRFQHFERARRQGGRAFIDRRTGAAIAEDEADILVGADGIHSAVRRQIYPNEGEPNFAGQILWRAAVETAPFLGGATMIIAGHFHRRIIAYPVAPRRAAGKLLTNWIAQMTVATTAPPREDWNRKVGERALHRRVPRLAIRLARFSEARRRDRRDFRIPAGRSPSGRALELRPRDVDRRRRASDAADRLASRLASDRRCAHADGRALAERDPVAALAAYDATRRPPMNDITLRNRTFGPEAAMQLAEERAPQGFKQIEDVIPRAELEAISRSFQQAAGLEPAALNARPSFVPAGASIRGSLDRPHPKRSLK